MTERPWLEQTPKKNDRPCHTPRVLFVRASTKMSWKMTVHFIITKHFVPLYKSVIDRRVMSKETCTL